MPDTLSDPVRLLALPFEQAGLSQALEAAGEGAQLVFLNAAPYRGSALAKHEHITCVQHQRSEFLALEASGAKVVALPEQASSGISRHDASLVLSSKHRGLNETHVNCAITMTAENALIVIAGSKTSGIASLRKAISKQVEIEDSMSKFHGMVFWFKNPGRLLFTKAPRTQVEVVSNKFAETAAGMFSHKKVDTGSRLLADLIEADFSGKVSGSVADFGSGWGYLGMRLLNSVKNVDRFSSHEADFRALEASKANLAQFKTDAETVFHWHDLVSETVPREHDWIITNPPFHDGRHADPELGRSFIRRAADALKPHGKMLMVANVHLPYERQLAQLFPRHKLLAEEKGFKIIQAWR